MEGRMAEEVFRGNYLYDKRGEMVGKGKG